MKTKSSVVILVTGIAAGIAVSAAFDWTPTLTAQDAKPTSKARAELTELEKGYRAFTEAFRRVPKVVQPSVVRIVVDSKPQQEKPDRKEQPRRRRRGPWDSLPEEFRKWFEERSPHGFRRYFDEMPFQRRRHGIGTGVIVDADGHILTNNHVVEGFKEGEISVWLYGEKTSIEAKVKGTDPKSDLAVIKIDTKKKLEPATFGDSDNLQVGDWVMALGHPFEYSNSVSQGIISAKGRKDALRGLNHKPFAVQDFIQTDAAINPGNSGGPLVNLRGEVVGINTFIASRSGGYQGIGFAVPSRIAQKVARALVTKGRVVRGYLGVSIANISDPVAEQLGMADAEQMLKKLNIKEPTGAVVIGQPGPPAVVPGGPAAKAGLEDYDLIVEFDGKAVTSRDDLIMLVRNTDPGKKVKVEVLRDGKSKTVTVEVGEQPDDVEVAQEKRQKKPSVSKDDVYGMRVQTLTPEMAERLSLAGVKGVVVTEVEEGSPADRNGIEVNDVIVRVGLTRVVDVKEFMELIKEAEEVGIVLNIRGKGMVILK